MRRRARDDLVDNRDFVEPERGLRGRDGMDGVFKRKEDEQMRDLQKDLEEWIADYDIGALGEWFYLTGEYIERAIKAEAELAALQDQIAYLHKAWTLYGYGTDITARALNALFEARKTGLEEGE